jgi:subtilisin-like proprotein convertase family protein
VYQRGILALLIGGLLAAGVACTTEQPQLVVEDPPYGSQDDVVRLVVSPAYVNFGTEDREDLTVVAQYETGDDVDVTGQVNWVVGDEDIVSMDGASAVGVSVGVTQVYATLSYLTSNMATIEVGHFTYTIECVSDTETQAKQAEMVLCSVDIEGREFDEDHPEYVTFEIEGFIPFGHDRASLGLPTTNYFWVDDENTFKALFLIPPSLPVGGHDVVFEFEGMSGEGDKTVGVSAASLGEKTCGELQAQGIIGAFNERKYRVIFDHSPRAHLIEGVASVGSQLDTALWLFDDEGNLFTWTDNPRMGGTDASLPFGITQDLEGEYYLTLTASPYAATEATESGQFTLTCDEELVEGETFAGDKEVAIPYNQMTELTIDVNVGVTDLIDEAWAHVDLETDVPSQVSVALVPPDPEADPIGLRSTGYDADRLAMTWDDDLVPPDSGHLYGFNDREAYGTWTLLVEDFSPAGNTILHNWELYLTTSPP